VDDVARQLVDSLAEASGHRLLTTTDAEKRITIVVDIDEPNVGALTIDEPYLEALAAATTREEREAITRKHFPWLADDWGSEWIEKLWGE
jgi:hypothetical protein